ncbi:MAG TPA: sigma-70 family RNA polymerase sigma factor [Myxococcota bacterium]|nr:sigma-70 family RNA polymerase sigma factor [Myxococcota bacterium]
MYPEPSQEVTALLDAWSGGDRAALDRLVPLVIEDLRALARAYLARENPGHTLQPTALVNEAFLRLIGRRQVQIEGRVQFFAVLAQTMRRILVDHARRKKAARHGGGAPPVPIEEAWGLPVREDVDLVALDEALDTLASFAPRQAEAIQLSYFGGLTFDEIALAQQVSPVTVKRDLKAAKMWLLQELENRPPTGGQ